MQVESVCFQKAATVAEMWSRYPYNTGYDYSITPSPTFHILKPKLREKSQVIIVNNVNASTWVVCQQANIYCQAIGKRMFVMLTERRKP